MKRIIFYIITVLMTQAALTACGSLPPWAKLPTKPESVQAPPIDTPATIVTPAPNRARIHRLLEEKDYSGALNLIQEERRKGADELSLVKEYLQAANGGLNEAATLMTRGQYATASLRLKSVKDNYPRTPELQKKIVATPEQIASDIDICSQNLMEAGLAAYRAGELSNALGIWQQILAVNPQHQAARNASQTTQQQLNKLKTLNDKI